MHGDLPPENSTPPHATRGYRQRLRCAVALSGPPTQTIQGMEKLQNVMAVTEVLALA